jgi:hypothetical protein
MTEPEDEDEQEWEKVYRTAGEYMSGTEGIQTNELKIDCVECGKHYEQCSGHGHSEPPQPGDVTICWDCGCIMQIVHDGVVRATPEQIKQVLDTLGLGARFKFAVATGKQIH